MRKILLLFLPLLLALTSCDPTIVNPNNTANSLCGEWEILTDPSGNMPGIKVRVQGSQGVVIDPGSSAYAVGDVKWDNIESQGIFFRYDEITETDSTLPQRLMLVSEGFLYTNMRRLAINTAEQWAVQKYIPCDTLRLTCEDITRKLILADGPSAIDYIVPQNCLLNILDSLIIEPGVTIAFADSAALVTGSFGPALVANGTAGEPVTFRGLNPSRGSWRGLYFTSDSDNLLDHVVVEHAGQLPVFAGKQAASIFTDGGEGTLSIRNTTLREGLGNGIASQSNLFSFWICENNTIETHSEYPLYIPFDALSNIDGMNSSFTGNDKDTAFIPLVGAFSVDASSTVKKIDLPYLIEGGTHLVKAILEIEAGVELIADADAALQVFDPGTIGNLVISGTSTDPVIIKGKRSTPGYWAGIYLDLDPSFSAQIDYLEISDAGGAPINGAIAAANIFVQAGQLTLQNSSLSNSANCGVALSPNGTLSQTGNSFSNNPGGDICP
ncbi:MAG: hypothetical protein AAFV78_02845 [Bacteroidota bacterium]